MKHSSLQPVARAQFIYISPAELAAVAAHIQTRGRISIAELAVEANALIDLQGPKGEAPEAADDLFAIDAT